MSDPFSLRLLRYLPRNLVSRIFGWIASRRRPRCLVRPFMHWFARQFKLDLAQAERPIEEYDCLLSLFTRRLKAGARPLDPAADSLISPVDAKVGAFGRIQESTLLQAKGMEYRVEALLGGPPDGVDVGDAKNWAESFRNGSYATLYLSPRDYHRIHAPIAGQVFETRYEPGTLWPVNPPAVRSVPQLFAVNERVCSMIQGARGPVAVVMVGATNVGRIRVAYQPMLSNAGHPREHRRHQPAIPLARGDEVGTFELGSTVVLLVADPEFRWEGLEEGQWLPMGQRIGGYPGASGGAAK